MNKIVNLLGTGESNEVVDYYPTNPAQETKQTKNNNKYILMIIIIIKRKKKKTERL